MYKDKLYNFIYKTSPLNPDTDFDSQNDYNDPVPLDYDMDGDGYINHPGLVDSPQSWYTPRLALAVRNDPNIKKGEDGKFVGDSDIDEDELEKAGLYDDDYDADGMSNWYEDWYGINPYGASEGKGWQNMFIYNARYAVIIGGGSMKSELNISAFRNDLDAMYKKLTENNYLDENIYCFLWNSQRGDLSGKVDGPSVWDDPYGYAREMFPTSIFIQEGLAAIGERITKNDFFFFVEICHGTKREELNDATFKGIDVISEADGTLSITERDYFFGPSGIPSGNPSLGTEIDTYIKWYSRALFVFQSCGASSGISRIAGKNRIVITAQNNNTDPWVVMDSNEGDTWTEMDGTEHWAFIYEGRRWYPYAGIDDHYPGFILSLGTLTDAKNILEAFNKGYDAASRNYINNFPFPGETSGRSHPMLEDTSANGISGTQGKLKPSATNDEGWLAEHTYL